MKSEKISWVKQFVAWMKQPSSWLSLSATFVSVTTFFLVYAYPGRLKVILPDRVGIQYVVPKESVRMLLPLTFTNTGAPRTRCHIIRVKASLDPRQHTADSQGPMLAWEFEKTFVGKRQWLKQYPEAKQGTEDYIDYVGRAFAFPLVGGTSVSKLFEIHQFRGSLSGKTLADFNLKVEVLKEKGSVVAERRYSCPGEISDKIFTWCTLLPDQEG